jgi:hypothetical protein
VASQTPTAGNYRIKIKFEGKYFIGGSGDTISKIKGQFDSITFTPGNAMNDYNNGKSLILGFNFYRFHDWCNTLIEGANFSNVFPTLFLKEKNDSDCPYIYYHEIISSEWKGKRLLFFPSFKGIPFSINSLNIDTSLIYPNNEWDLYKTDKIISIVSSNGKFLYPDSTSAIPTVITITRDTNFIIQKYIVNIPGISLRFLNKDNIFFIGNSKYKVRKIGASITYKVNGTELDGISSITK